MNALNVDDFPAYDGSIDIDVWKARRKRELRIALAKQNKMLTYTDTEGSPLYKLTENGNLVRTKTMSPGTRAEVIRRDNACVWCSSAGPFEVDHVIRYVDGGSNEASNLQTLCAPCHRSKGGRA